MTNTARALAVSTGAAYIAVLAVHHGLAVAPAVVGPLLLAAIVLPLTSRFRERAAESGLLAAAVAILAVSAMGVAYGYAPRLPLSIPWQWVVWVPVIISALLLESAAALSGIRGSLAATAVAGAAFMIYPGQGVDTITVYDNQTSSLVIAAFIVAVAAIRPRFGVAFGSLARLLCPFIVVALGCFVHWLEGGPRYARDVLVFVPLISALAALAAGFTVVAEAANRGRALRRVERPN